MNVKQAMVLVPVGALLGWLGAQQVTERRRGAVVITPPQAAYEPPPQAAIWLAHFSAAEQQHGLPHNLLVRVAQQESNFNPAVVSSAGAVGLMQIIPRWHPEVDAYDPVASIYYAAGYLRKNYDRFGSWVLALAAYNWGPTVLARDGLENAPRETVNYIAQIVADIPEAGVA